jgi:hypothetical protein
VRRSWCQFPVAQAARPLARKLFSATDFWWIRITLARYDRKGIFGRSFSGVAASGSGQLFLPLAVGLAVFAMLGSTAICSTVFSVSFPSGLLPASKPLKIDGSQPAFFAAKDLSRMPGRKKAVARPP